MFLDFVHYTIKKRLPKVNRTGNKTIVKSKNNKRDDAKKQTYFAAGTLACSFVPETCLFFSLYWLQRLMNLLEDFDVN